MFIPKTKISNQGFACHCFFFSQSANKYLRYDGSFILCAVAHLFIL